MFSQKIFIKIAAIPVTNNQFKWETKENLPMDEYVLEFGNKKYPLVFGKGDWFDLFFRLNATKMLSYVKATEKQNKIILIQKKILPETSNINWTIKNLKIHRNSITKYKRNGMTVRSTLANSPHPKTLVFPMNLKNTGNSF